MDEEKNNKKIIIKRNMISALVGVIFVFIVISVFPLYQIMSDMTIKDIDLTMSEINQKYLYIIAIILIITFMVGFYLTKAIFNFLLSKNIKIIKKKQ